MRSNARYFAWIIAASASVLSPLHAEDVGLRPSDIASVFHISNSDSRNQVHYAVHASAACAPSGDAPLFVYWRDLEDGAHATSRISTLEERGYGIAYQRRAEVANGSTVLRVALRGVPERELQVAMTVADGRCTAEARTRIAGSRAVLDQIFVQTRGLFGIEWIELRGRRMSDGLAVHERVNPS